MKKVGRNDPCPCGSGKKYKRCCLEQSAEVNVKPPDPFNLKGKKAEAAVYDMATKTFLTDWCYLNPRLPDEKELCDLLVVFDDTAVIMQIKDLKLDHQGKYKKSEVEKNLRQLAGARRQLLDLKTKVELKNPRRGRELFDPSTIKKVYLISVLFGEGEAVYSSIETIKDHIVHVFNRDFTGIILSELDTIADFCHYLEQKELLAGQKKSLIILGGAEELLAHYLLNERSFDNLSKANAIVMDGGLWDSLQNKPEFKAKKKEDEISYGWDSMIDRAHESNVPEYEIVAREMARLNRFERRVLSKAYMEAAIIAHQRKEGNQFRRVVPLNGVTYCFLFMDDPEPREVRKAALGTVCYVARGRFPENNKVIGIATEMTFQPTCSYDFCLIDKPTWTPDDQKLADQLQKKFGIFENVEYKPFSEDEYPQQDST